MTASNHDRSVAQPTSAASAASADIGALDAEGARLLAELGVSEDAPVSEGAGDDADVEHFTPRASIEHALALRGRTLDDARLPSTLIATFDASVYRDLIAATSAGQAPQTPPEVIAVMQGAIGERPVALRKLGIGAPAAVTVLEELIALGARDILIVGTGGSLQPALPIGSFVVPTGAIREEGTSFHYVPAGAELAPDATLAQALAESIVAQGSVVTFGPVWTTDAPYREMRSKVAAYGAAGALAVEMEASALFALAQFRGVRLALLLAISDELFHEWRPGFHSAELRAAKKLMTQAALQVAGSVSEQP
ncbi:MAG TPA: nucleoside phosphorylase [Ktedonobacterales bacterium]|jgi:uridine phosphorylase|nr:nucleoside phosphorylase [Ktedonobacterales bacterium]